MSDDIELSDMPGHLIRRLNQHSTAVFQEQVGATGDNMTSVQFAALSALRNTPGIDQATLASRIAYDRATIGGVVERLLRKGLVDRRINKDDRRARLLWLTNQGAEALANLTPIVRDLQADILSNLTKKERKAFMQLARKALSLERQPQTQA